MAYEKQQQIALERLDRALLALNKLIKTGKQKEAIEFMDNGPLKDVYEELQNIITISQTSGLGARGTSQTGTF
jgi:hypothetical protein